MNTTIQHLILHIVSHDYEDFGTIMSELRSELVVVPLDIQEVARNAVRELVFNGTIECFRYNDGFDKVDPGGFRADAILEYYFYISKAGREVLEKECRD